MSVWPSGYSVHTDKGVVMFLHNMWHAFDGICAGFVDLFRPSPVQR